ncbi:hypothetical protein Ga0074812_13124 [Parafrankia irregularis]|uniref:Uncharacterized protein n=1 Tax=Parafrankia irregularis TaxID=795642 RepID=A0A0S4QXB9_9ACTN|nr:hypothetical protein Ga0074812_13124 [Parafrankia irregularis]
MSGLTAAATRLDFLLLPYRSRVNGSPALLVFSYRSGP